MVEQPRSLKARIDVGISLDGQEHHFELEPYMGTQIEEVEREAFKNSCSHSRHLEDQRQKMMTLFYTIFLSIIGLLGVLYEQGGLDGMVVHMDTAFLVMSAFSIFGLFVYIYVTKLQIAISAHGKIIHLVLSRQYGEKFVQYYDNPLRNQFKRGAKSSPLMYLLSKSGFTSINQISRLFITMPLVILCVFSWFVAIQIIQISILPFSAPLLVSFSLITMSVVSILLFIDLIVSRQDSMPPHTDEVGESEEMR